MRGKTVIFLIVAFAIFPPCVVTAQEASPPKLSRQLRAEDPERLAKDARAKGSAVRGAILFAQKSLGCASCHARGGVDLVGPDLTQLGSSRKDVDFVHAILDPSREISKGFEAVKILTDDGEIVIGRIIRRDDQHVTLRRASDRRELIHLSTDQINEIRDETVSAMPVDLADQLRNRQEFLDLVKYVMDISDTGTQLGGHRQDSIATSATLDQRIQGLTLIDHYGCRNCHESPTLDALPVPAKKGPHLANVAGRLNLAHVRKFLVEPQAIKRGTAMPSMLHLVDAQNPREVADAITQYLASLSNLSLGGGTIDVQAAARGKILFHEVGCVACHAPRDDNGSEVLRESSVALGDLNRKYSIESLAAFLEDPHQARPLGRMPNLKLSHWESIDLANYLVSVGGDGLGDQVSDSATRDEPPKSDPGAIESGRRHFRRLGCGQCHDIGEQADSLATYPTLDDLDPDRGCLGDSPGAHPLYELKEDERNVIRQAIDELADPFTAREQVSLSMETFRCYSCHRRDSLGGVTDERDVYFHTTNENLGPQGRIPPSLTGVGGKLRPKWLRQVLVSGRAIRPYVKTRMPQYGTRNVEHLVELFGDVDSKPLVDLPKVKDAKEARKIGAELVGSSGLNCIACHTFQQQPALTMPAVDLTEMAERLHEEWFVQYMLSPQSLSPNTVMPSFWPGGKAIRKDIADGDPEQQLGAIWEYLREGRQARTPRGLRREPIELLASPDRAVMLRRSYREIGKRGIGVGYPGGVNLAFDAEQMRLAMIWKGKFADPAGVWRSQGHGSVRPLGTDLIRFQKGPDFDDATAPWVVDEGRPPNHRFGGYYLDEQARPTFMYRFGDVEVEDYFSEIETVTQDSVGPALDRRIRFETSVSVNGRSLRIANGKIITKVGKRFRIDDGLYVSVEDGPDAEIKVDANGRALVLPLDLKPGRTTIGVIYEWQ